MSETTRGYPELPVNVAPDVPHYVNLALQVINDDVDALAEAAEAEATEQAGMSRSLAEVLTATELRLPRHLDVGDYLLAALRDAQGFETWLGARRSDGGPTDHAMRHLEMRTGLAQVEADGLLFALKDRDGFQTDLTIRDSDGQFEDFVIDRLRKRIMAGYAAPRQYVDAPYSPGSDVFPLAADSTRAAGFGSSTLEGLDPFLGEMFAGLGVSYYAGGKGGEHAQHIAARMGAVPALVTVEGGTVPASGEVPVTVSNMALARALRPYPGTLAGVRGLLAFREGSPITYTFTRSTPGTAVPVPADTAFIPDAREYRDAVQILNIGKNNMGGSGADALVVELTNACFDWLAPLVKRCLVVGHFVNTGTPAVSVQRDQIAVVNAAAKARYGRLYVDLSAYLTGPQVWADTGITPTAEDLAEQKAGNKPPSLSRDAAHMNNAAGQAAVKALFEPLLTEIGWYKA